MYWHIDADIFSLIIMVTVYAYYVSTHPASARDLRVRSFIACFQAGMAIAVIDIAASVVMEVPTTRFLYHFLMMLYMASIVVVILAWFIYALSILYQYEPKRLKLAIRLLMLPYFLYLLMVISNPWTGLMFTLDADMVYARGPCFFVMVALYAVYAVALMAEVTLNRKRIPAGYSGYILLMTPVILGLAIVIQLSVPGWLTVVPGYTICLLMAFLFLQTRESYQNRALVQTLSKNAMIDKLTGLYNRAGMETMVRGMEQNYYGDMCMTLVIDLDDLKLINDTLGHAQGDIALRAIAAQLKAHYRSTDLLSRFGGDEFVAYLVGGWTEEKARLSLAALIERIKPLCVGENEDVPIHGSIGAAIGIVGVDSFQTLSCQADTAMYYVKRSHKGGFALYRAEMEDEMPRGAIKPALKT